MGLLDFIGRKRSRDKPHNSYEGQDFSYLFGRTSSGENVDEFKAMQTTAVYACVRILAELSHLYPFTFTKEHLMGGRKNLNTLYISYFMMNQIQRCLLLSFVRL